MSCPFPHEFQNLLGDQTKNKASENSEERKRWLKQPDAVVFRRGR